MSLHHADVVQRIRRFLDRRSVPRAIEGKQKAMLDEVNALAEAVARYAPKGEALANWWPMFEARLGEVNATRAWPTEGEVRLAAQDCKPQNTMGGGMAEERAVDLMVEWFDKFKSQRPTYGSPGRTAELIRRGVFANEREARFGGFYLSTEQSERVRAQPMGADEWANHVRIIAGLKGISIGEAEFLERSLLSVSEIPVRRQAPSPRPQRFGTSDGF